MDYDKKYIDSLSNITFDNINVIPDWKKELWVNLIKKEAEENWIYEKLAVEYEKLFEKYILLKNENNELIKCRQRFFDLNIEIETLKRENNKLKNENISIMSENIEKNKSFSKLKDDNEKLIESLLESKEKESELQNKIFELEMRK